MSNITVNLYVKDELYKTLTVSNCPDAVQILEDYMAQLGAEKTGPNAYTVPPPNANYCPVSTD